MAASLGLVAVGLTTILAAGAPRASGATPGTGVYTASLGRYAAPVRAASTIPKLAVPNNVYLGGWITPNSNICTTQCELANYPTFTNSIGRHLAILGYYNDWLSLPGANVLNAIYAAGAVPLLSMHCYFTGSNGKLTPASDADINAGLYDSYIAALGTQLAGLKYPVLFRWLYEMNNYHESFQFDGCLGAQGPAGYIAAWQRIWQIFQAVGATNVSFVWNPSGSVAVTSANDPNNDLTGQPYPTMMQYWPGSQYVDWAGFDFYDHRDGTAVQPDDFSGHGNFFDTAYTTLTSSLPGVPLMIGETAALNPADQALYINDIDANAQPVRPAIHAVVWFDADPNNDLDWTFNPAGLQAFATLAANPYFGAMPQAVPFQGPCTPGANRNLTAEPVAISAMTNGVCPGYWIATVKGEVTTFGAAGYYGDVRTARLAAPVIAMTTTPDDGGYWLLSADGGVFTFGDAQFFGSTGGIRLRAPIVSMAPTADGRGYWLVAADGGVFSFGDAVFYGSTGGVRLNAPVVGMAGTGDGQGYWLVASDGGIFAFGDAPFYGSTGGVRLARPVIGMTADPVYGGYRLVASDGGVFDFNATFYGSLGGVRLSSPIVSLSPTWLGTGYYLIGSDGGVFSFGNAPYFGRLFW